MTDTEYYQEVLKIGKLEEDGEIDVWQKLVLSILLNGYKYLETRGFVKVPWQVILQDYLDVLEHSK